MRDYARIFQFVARSQTQASEIRVRQDEERFDVKEKPRGARGFRARVCRTTREWTLAASLWMRRATSRMFDVDFIINSLVLEVFYLYENNFYN